MFELHPQLAKDCVVLGDLALSQVLLCKDSNYPWLILVPKREAVREIYELPAADQVQLIEESSAVSQLLAEHFDAHKLNVAALGNMVPQLHLHHVVRFEHDVAWPKPIWGVADMRPYDETALVKIVAQLRQKLSSLHFTAAG